MCTICASLDPARAACAYSETLPGGAVALSSVAAALPSPGPRVIADYILSHEGYGRMAWDKQDASGTTALTVNITGLTSEGQRLARAALEAWESVADLAFTVVQGAADITFDDDQPGAFADHNPTGHVITWATVNVAEDWLTGNGATYDSYSLQTYIHEIGHALGLSHLGPYDGYGTYGRDAIYANDSWQLSVMSYFSQTDNTVVNASFGYAVTPMIVDILAVQSLYGAPDASSATAGNTTYGNGATLSGYLDDLYGFAFDGQSNAALYYGDPVALTIYDRGGVDTINLSRSTADNRVDLIGGRFSDVNGGTGNLAIDLSTEIENATGGRGDDTLSGSALSNVLRGNGGNDVLKGHGSNDRLFGGAGRDLLDGSWADDRLEGGTGADTLLGGGGLDILSGGQGLDRLQGGWGHDRLDGGADGDRLAGNGGHDTLLGGQGDDTLLGGTQHDRLFGTGGDDVLWGGAGNDSLTGGAGADTLGGGAGADTIVFARGAGADRVLGFADDVDTLRLDADLWGGAALTPGQVIHRFAAVTNGALVFDFGGGDVLTLAGVTAKWALSDDIVIV